ncbi:hypothetical protein KAFR_0F03770 [Kazachstania africana CBS 2517]|uniref:Uncharacterized protein n=1 Tax=Kazachstania africana (strain ATCC 22294 / BCRC 22015 / CBS 2517 / CECT 1963 / NBRC 1671 / NRRL Y-8276) TaxID=1071382 RepID=H2AX73_KAZAF|nr:hypothetical protein KAFR_0F03770 [Kazachstania africana CBS 2517]CCF58973.1 hypothetical protein KAFR_0F03770 [Kazachstania africana CBS 2517]
MSTSIVYESCSKSFIQSYFATKTHIVIAEKETLRNKIVLKYINRNDVSKITILSTNIQSSKSVREISICNSFIILNLVTAIQIIKVGNLDESDSWNLSNYNDEINTIYTTNSDRDNALLIYIGTKLGNLIQVRYISELQRFDMLSSTSDLVADSINSIKGIENEIVLSSYDNFIYSKIEDKYEKQHCEIEDDDTNVVTWCHFIKLPKYSNSFLRFYAVHITNFGCQLYRRSTRGEWTLSQYFKKKQCHNEKSSSLDCFVKYLENDRILIISGSEVGKLYYWVYDFKNEVTTETKIVHLPEGKLIHSISMIDNDKIFFISNDNKCINALYI